LLVSFIALDELLGDVSADQDAAAAPVEVVAEDAPAEEAAAPVKKAGRPKKVAADAAATDTPDATEQDAQ
jgi:hypothetical protein